MGATELHTEYNSAGTGGSGVAPVGRLLWTRAATSTYERNKSSVAGFRGLRKMLLEIKPTS
jgi:hypothetical protein